MPSLLHIDASPRGEQSISRSLSAAAAAAWRSKHPEGRVVERDLAHADLTFVDLNWIMGSAAPVERRSAEQQQALAISDELVDELLAADTIIIGTPMYNFAIPAVLKAWVDHVVRPGRTFNYTATGPQGHAAGRKVIVAVASGGVYAGTPMEAYDLEIPYLRHILGFIGITDVTFIQAGGTAAIAQGKVSPAEFLRPFVEKAQAAV